MMDLFDWHPNKGKTDTSEEAAMKISSVAKTLRDKTYHAILDKEMTASEIAEKLGHRLLGIRPRTTELKDNGYIKDSGDRRKNQYGNNEIVWAITDKPTEATSELF